MDSNFYLNGILCHPLGVVDDNGEKVLVYKWFRRDRQRFIYEAEPLDYVIKWHHKTKNNK